MEPIDLLTFTVGVPSEDATCLVYAPKHTCHMFAVLCWDQDARKWYTDMGIEVPAIIVLAYRVITD